MALSYKKARKMSDLRGIVDSILVPHGAFEEALRRMSQYFSYAEAGAYEPVCIALVGESRTGKSRCAEVFMRRHPPIRDADGLQVPILSIVVPSRPTVKALVEIILQALGATDWEKGTENAKTARLTLLMKECRVLTLVLDEFHHFYDKGSHKVQHHVADWLKNFVGKTKVILLVSGLPSLQFVIDQNEQLAGRFTSPIHMPRFDWHKKDHREEWIAILGAFTEGLGSKFDLPELDGDDMALRMYCATGGLMGYLTKTLRQAVWSAVDANKNVITMKDIELAYAESIWSRERLSHLPNPFDREQLVYPTPEVIAQTKLIGTPFIPPPIKRTRARVGEMIAPASSIVVA